MPRKLTSASTLENLRREAKRWLKALRSGDTAARTRLERTHPEAPIEVTLRDAQHALAREYGLSGWGELKREVSLIEAARDTDPRPVAIGRLLEAAAEGDTATVIALLDRHPDIVSERAVIRGHTGLRSALHHAIGHADTVEALLARGADPDVRDEGDNAMPLHFAAEREDLRVIRLLVEHGADPIGAGDTHELEVIGWATVFGSGRAEVTEYLLAHGSRHNILSAVATGATDAIREIFASSPREIDRVMDRTNHHRRPSHLAVVRKQEGSLATLLELGADAGATDAAGLTPLDQAALDGSTAMVEMLLEHGAELHLPAAIALERAADVERLLREDPHCLKPGNRWGTLIVRAAERASGSMIERLLRAGASPNAVDDTETSIDQVAGYTALHAAAFHGNTVAAGVLLEQGANPRIRDGKYCGTPAGWAAYAGHEQTLLTILAGRIDPFEAIDFDLADRIGEIIQREPWLLEKPFREYATCATDGGWSPEPWHTPLVWAVIKNKPDAVRALLELGAMQPIARMPEEMTLVRYAREAGHEDVARSLEQYQRIEATHEGRVRWFVMNACPDHTVRGGPAHVVARHTAARLLRDHPDITRDSLFTAIICGDIAEVERVLSGRPASANEKGGPKNREPLLYLCFTRLPDVPQAIGNAVEIARLLLDHGADPNAYFMAGDSRYTPLVGAIGEGEEGRPAHPRRNELVRLLLDRGAEPCDIQVLYNIHFHGRALWFLDLIHERSLALGRAADWADPEWRMLDMGAYGTGARYVLGMAIRHDDAALAEWALSHGASPNAPPASDPRFPKHSLYALAVRTGRQRIAELLVRHGAEPEDVVLDDEDAFVAACLQLDVERVRGLVARNPEFLRSPKAVIAAAKRNRADVVSLLLDLGTPIEIENERAQRPLHHAAWADSGEVAKLLIGRGAEIDAVESQWNNTPLDFAVYEQHTRMIELLAPHSRDIRNLVFVGAAERLRELFDQEPDLARTRASGGETPLMSLPDEEAVATEIVRLFLENGADASVRSRQGLTAADYASRRGLREAAALLRRHESPDDD